MSTKVNYEQLQEKELERIISLSEFQNRHPSLLLHSCCAPCSSYVIEYLSRYFSITIFYYNPNIHPENEYNRRRDELAAFISTFPPAAGIRLVIPPYTTGDYFDAVNTEQEPELQTEPERGERCRRCYTFRMKAAFTYAVAHKFDYCTSTLSISPYKDAEKINTAGKQLEQEFKRLGAETKYLYADFKKKNGFKRSLELSSQYNLYRQNYCGCIFSMRNGKTIPVSDKSPLHKI